MRGGAGLLFPRFLVVVVVVVFVRGQWTVVCIRG